MHESFDKPEELGPNQGKEYQASNFHDDEDDVPVDDITPRQTRPPLRRKPLRRPPLRRHYDED